VNQPQAAHRRGGHCWSAPLGARARNKKLFAPKNSPWVFLKTAKTKKIGWIFVQNSIFKIWGK
jgi:hypothetical protein